MKTVHLHGRLKKEFGPKHRFEIDTAIEAIRALDCAFPGKFIEAISAGDYHIIRGNRHSGAKLDIESAVSLKLGRADVHIVPASAGSGSAKGTVAMIAGAAIVGAAIFASGGSLAAPLASLGNAIPGLPITWGNVAAIGLGAALLGVSDALAKAEPNQDKQGDEAKSFAFSGPINVNEQGNAIPVIFGELIVGSQTISGGLNIENIGSYQSTQDLIFSNVRGTQ